MNNTVQIRVDKSLASILEDLRKEVAFNLKNKYNLEEITVPMTLSSQILAAKLQGQKTMSFRIKKSSLNKGCLEIV